MGAGEAGSIFFSHLNADLNSIITSLQSYRITYQELKSYMKTSVRVCV